jgi:hypothetical protein
MGSQPPGRVVRVTVGHGLAGVVVWPGGRVVMVMTKLLVVVVEVEVEIEVGVRVEVGGGGGGGCGVVGHGTWLVR